MVTGEWALGGIYSSAPAHTILYPGLFVSFSETCQPLNQSCLNLQAHMVTYCGGVETQEGGYTLPKMILNMSAILQGM